MSTGSSPTICCCSAFASAGINVGLQLLCSVIGLSSASLILSREHFWKFMEMVLDTAVTSTTTQMTTHFTHHTHHPNQFPGQMQPHFIPTFQTPSPPNILHGPECQEHDQHIHHPHTMTETHTQSSVTKHGEVGRMSLKWIDAWIELGMTWYTGFATVWMLTLVGVCLSFRFYRPVLIIPNIVTLYVGLLFNLIAFGSLAWVISAPMSENNYEHIILIYIMCSFLIILLLNLAFIHISMHYYAFLDQKFAASLQRIYPNSVPDRSSSVTKNEDVEKN